MRNLLATLGLIFGFIAVGLAVFENNFIHRPPPPSTGEALKQTASKAAKTWLNEKVLRQQAPHEEMTQTDPRRLPLLPYQMIYSALGLLALGLGVASWCRREHIRMSGGAISLGMMAMCWQWVLVGIVIAVIILVIANVSA